MAVAPTGAIYKALKFDNVSSRTYGVYITGEAVYNAPERDVEMITIPGRSGSFALDNGRFENITVTYPAGIFAETEADFRAAISDFRNFLCSRKGYVRLQDEYNPNEYRMAVYKSGLEVEPAMLKAGEFDITFDCKPQRWLTSGETAVSVTSGDTITNPTLFEASPLLEVEGYGTIDVNGTEIEINNDPIGDVVIASNINESKRIVNISFPEVYLMPGDLIEVYNAAFEVSYSRSSGNHSISSATLVSYTGDTGTNPTVTVNSPPLGFTYDIVFTSPLQFYYGTSSEKKVAAKIRVVTSAAGSPSAEKVFNVYVRYDGDKNIQFNVETTYIVVSGSGASDTFSIDTIKTTADSIEAHSTATTFGHPTYIDCDLGEAYADDNGVISSLNSYIELGSKLPTLASGSNTITYDNTITSLKIAPRWWKV